MNIAKWAKNMGSAAYTGAANALGASAGFVSSQLGLLVASSTATSGDYDEQQFDEKHYFLVPDRRSEVGYSCM